MTPDQERVKALLPIIEAYARGEEIEIMGYDGKWKSIINPGWDARAASYRIKPKPLEFWTNVYCECPLRFGYHHATKDAAKRLAGAEALRIAHFREVL